MYNPTCYPFTLHPARLQYLFQKDEYTPGCNNAVLEGVSAIKTNSQTQKPKESCLLFTQESVLFICLFYFSYPKYKAGKECWTIDM